MSGFKYSPDEIRETTARMVELSEKLTFVPPMSKPEVVAGGEHRLGTMMPLFGGCADGRWWLLPTVALERAQIANDIYTIHTMIPLSGEQGDWGEWTGKQIWFAGTEDALKIVTANDIVSRHANRPPEMAHSWPRPIPVSERLPEKKGDYLTFNAKWKEWAVSEWTGRWCQYLERDELDVTHWLPIPPAPEQA